MGILYKLSTSKIVSILPSGEAYSAMLTLMDSQGRERSIAVRTDSFRKELERIRDGACDWVEYTDGRAASDVFANPEAFTPDYGPGDFWNDLFDLRMRDFIRLIKSLE